MAIELVQIRELAERKEDENSRLRQFLKTECNLEPDEIDRRVFETCAYRKLRPCLDKLFFEWRSRARLCA